VGEDQTQHLELSRTIAEMFNRTFEPIFPLPQTRIVPSKRILSLRDPSQKMSKSSPDAKSRIGLTDTPGEISKKIKSAVTDSDLVISYDPATRPGLSNLLMIWSALDEQGRSPEVLAGMVREQGWGMGKLKAELEGVIVQRIEPGRKEYLRIQADIGYLREVAQKGRDAAREVASKTMSQVRHVVGLSQI
jgi:tryptophanyl-tRNA synthetase